MEVLLFTDVARGYCCNNQASRERRKERPPEPAKTLFVLHPGSGRRGCVRGEVWVGWRGLRCHPTPEGAALGSRGHWRGSGELGALSLTLSGQYRLY